MDGWERMRAGARALPRMPEDAVAPGARETMRDFYERVENGLLADLRGTDPAAYRAAVRELAEESLREEAARMKGVGQ